MRLSRDAILASRNTLRSEDVEVPEWGGIVRIREMTGSERDAWEQSLVGAKGKINIENVRARLVSRCAVDESGARLFSDEDAEALGQTSAAALERVARVAQKLNKLSETDLEEAKGN
jgi:hypothetical protein